jgi:hypothetical protein
MCPPEDIPEDREWSGPCPECTYGNVTQNKAAAGSIGGKAKAKNRVAGAKHVLADAKQNVANCSTVSSLSLSSFVQEKNSKSKKENTDLGIIPTEKEEVYR